jgi:hypothetical protein
MISVGVSAPGMESFFLALVSGYDFRMQAGADDKLCAGVDGGCRFFGGRDGAGAEQELRSIFFLELSSAPPARRERSW